MATYFVANGGSNTSPYDTWAKAATSLATALAAASSAGDVVVIQYNAVPSGDAEVAVDTTYTFASHVSLISASNDGGSAFTPTPMGASNWIGNSTTNRYVRLAGSDLRVLVYGLTLRVAGSTLDQVFPSQSAGSHMELEDCLLWHSGTATGSVIVLGISNAYLKLENCTLRFGATSQIVEVAGEVECNGLAISASGSTPTQLLTVGASSARARFTGCDLSLITGTLIGNISAPASFWFDRCKLGSGVVVLGTQSGNPNLASAHAWVSDCSSGDTHLTFGYHDALGSLTSETGIYCTASPATDSVSWKIATTANASYRTPFMTPWVDLYHTGTSAITPRFEILRDGSTSAYTDAEVWAEFAAKTTSGFTQASFFSDRQALAAYAAGTAGSSQAAGAGLGSWTGEGGSAWSGKVDSGASLTPAETGYLSGRVAVAAASATVYVDPVIRTS